MLYENEGNASALALVPRSAVRILDVGCGAGDNARLLHAAGHRVVGVTLSEDEARAARGFCDQVWVGDVQRMTFPSDAGQFDGILMSHVLEHLAEPWVAVDRVARLLKPRGWLVVAVPNMGFWRVRWRVLRGDWRREDTGFFDRTHLQFWSHTTASEVLRGTPFEILATKGADGSIPLRPLRRRFANVAAHLDRVATASLPNLCAGQVVLLARRVN